MHIASWNVNSIKVRSKLVLDWFNKSNCDILLIQETKSQDHNFPKDSFLTEGLNVVFHGQKSYNGVAIISRHPITNVSIGLPGDALDDQARYLEATVEGIRVATIYLPNGNPAPGPKFDYKISWMKRLFKQSYDLLKTEMPIILGGDFNVIPEDIDCYDPAGWEGDALTNLQARAAFRSVINLGYSDALRTVHQTGVFYTYWDYQAGAWQKDNGLRIDHLLLSPEAADRLSDAGVDSEPRGNVQPSDHAPVWCTLSD